MGVISGVQRVFQPIADLVNDLWGINCYRLAAYVGLAIPAGLLAWPYVIYYVPHGGDDWHLGVSVDVFCLSYIAHGRYTTAMLSNKLYELTNMPAAPYGLVFLLFWTVSMFAIFTFIDPHEHGLCFGIGNLIYAVSCCFEMCLPKPRRKRKFPKLSLGSFMQMEPQGAAS